MSDISNNQKNTVGIENITTGNDLAINTDGSLPSTVFGVAKGTTPSGNATTTAQSADRQGLDVQIRTSTGAAVDTFGGGQQYADGTARGTATGTLAMGDDGTNIQSLSVDPTGKLNVNNISGTVSLPTGAATSAKQDTMITSLSAIDAGIPAALGQTTMANSMPVVLASNQSSIPVTTEGAKLTYSAGFTNVTLAAATTDCFTITGSASKTIRITRIGFACTTTAGSGFAINLSVIKRSTVDTAGTSTTATAVPHDSTNAAGTAVVRSYTANPTLGTAVGNVYTDRFRITAAGSVGNKLDLSFGIRPSQTVVLRGTSQQICINLGGVSITGPVACFSVEWTEE